MGDFIAHNSRWRITGLILISSGFVLLGLWLADILEAPLNPRRSPTIVTIAIGWMSLAFFGLCGIGWAKRFFDRRAQLEIGPSGVRWRPWSDDLIPWSEVRKVTTSRVRNILGFPLQKFIVLHLQDPERFPGRGLAAKLAGANRMITRGDICISLSGTDRSYDDAMAAIALFQR